MKKIFLVQVTTEELMKHQIFFQRGCYDSFENALMGCSIALTFVDNATLVCIEEFDVNSHISCDRLVYTKSQLVDALIEREDEI